jgi:Ni/Co efflux regulator RcnB/surface antigen
MKKLILSALALSFFVSSAGYAQRYEDRIPRHDWDPSSWDQDQSAGTWSAGERLPRELMRDRYIYYNWRNSGLRPPPRGSRWMLIEDQYVLVNGRTSVIIDTADATPRQVERGRGYGNDRAPSNDRAPAYGNDRPQDGDREQRWRQRYRRTYTYNDDVAYTECRNQPDPAGVLAGAFLGDRTGPTVAGVIAGGALGAALTSKLDCSDRSYAYRTYSQGFNGGRANATYQWTNPQNDHRGEMHVLDYYQDEDNFRCAVFSQIVYINGRAEEARGRACQQPDGNWAIID